MNIFQQASGAVDWKWKPDGRFNRRFQRVAIISVELSADAGAGAVEVRWVDGEDPANDFKIIVATESLNNRSHRLISFEPPLLVEAGKVLQITYSNTASRAVKIAIFTA